MKTGSKQSRLDPHQPLVLDTRELGRRPGSMRALHITAPAPAGLGLVDLIGVPLGAQLDLDLRLESVMEGVLVSGTVAAPLAGECGRCLEPLTEELVVDLQELYAYPASTSEDTTDDDELSRMDGDLLDLEPALRDAVVLALPLTPLCREDCRGLCATCGERLDDLPDDHSHEVVDARWQALQGLLPDSTTHR
ncbi:MAG: DNA-binding protein [Frankiales bacterium]|jgi:uncharacterized protein|nr:DNA-binding protein [Frankiales bacterium]